MPSRRMTSRAGTKALSHGVVCEAASEAACPVYPSRVLASSRIALVRVAAWESTPAPSPSAIAFLSRENSISTALTREPEIRAMTCFSMPVVS